MPLHSPRRARAGFTAALAPTRLSRPDAARPACAAAGVRRRDDWSAPASEAAAGDGKPALQRGCEWELELGHVGG